LQILNRAIGKLSRYHPAITGGGLHQAFHSLLQLDMEGPGGRHYNDLAILQFIAFATLRTFRQM
jgi:hypothetical protein